MGLFKDLVGQHFGRLTVLSLDSTKKKGAGCYWLCQCECGVIHSVKTSLLTRGDVKSCGCLQVDVQRDRCTKHGKAGSKTYHVWQAMIQRCYNPNNPAYQWYGSRGITVCERWRFSFFDFLADMGESPPGYSIERKDNNGSYHVSNCIWIPRKLQSRNQRSTRLNETVAGRIREFRRVGISLKELSAMYAVSINHISRIAHYQNWR